MAVYKPPKLKRASEFLTDKKVKTSTPEKYYEVTSQKLGLYDLDTAYKGSIREEQEEKAAKRKVSMPSLSRIREESYNYDPNTEYLSQEEVGERNRAVHNREVKNDGDKKGFLEGLFSDNATDETRATLGTKKKIAVPRATSQKATLSGRQPERYSQQETDGRYMSDGDIRNQNPKQEDNSIRFRKDRAEALLQGIKDVPRNLGAGVIQALDTGAELLTGGQHNNAYKPRTEEDWKKASTPFKTYDEYLAHIDKLNEGVAEQKDTVNRIASPVTEETTFVEKAIRGAALNLPSS
ncbi:MAG: hypothetical protein EOM07_12715, partial [Clostridia bacterium]|nr:hypothetical protein [Clostridia bacterium]